jgi:hypothetical protein
MGEDLPPLPRAADNKWCVRNPIFESNVSEGATAQ